MSFGQRKSLEKLISRISAGVHSLDVHVDTVVLLHSGRLSNSERANLHVNVNCHGYLKREEKTGNRDPRAWRSEPTKTLVDKTEQ